MTERDFYLIIFYLVIAMPILTWAVIGLAGSFVRNVQSNKIPKQPTELELLEQEYKQVEEQYRMALGNANYTEKEFIDAEVHRFNYLLKKHEALRKKIDQLAGTKSVAKENQTL